MEASKKNHPLRSTKFYKMKHTFLLAATASVISMMGCNNSKSTTGSAANIGSELLYQSEWKLTEVQGTTVPLESRANLAFTPGQVNKVSGNTGCNRMNGSFELSGTNTIKFSPVATTKMACLDNNANELESKFTDALSKATSWVIDNNELMLKNGETVLAKLKGQKPPTKEEAKLNGTWQLNYISGAKIAFDGLFPDKKPFITFDLSKPEATGNGGCNGYSVKFTVNGKKISFGDALSTMMACEGNGEPVYFKTLKTVTSYSISDDNTLNMIMGDIAVMRFTRK